jgi:TetR/AcrR family transcriptional repressor of bet genes
LIDESINHYYGPAMPKTGMEPLRRRALIDAAIGAIGERGTLDVTMSDIAGRAGVSSALAHHYFGAKEDLLEATMRHLLSELARDSREALATAAGAGRVRAVISVNLSHQQFRPEVVAAWLAFYVEAQRSARLRRLLRVYARRLHSNLMSGLEGNVAEPAFVAEGIAALIDGLYIRRALKDGAPDAGSAVALVENYLDLHIGGTGRSS